MPFCLPLRSKLYKYWKPLKTSAESTHREDHACFVSTNCKKYALFTWRKCVDTILAEDKRMQEIEFLMKIIGYTAPIPSLNTEGSISFKLFSRRSRISKYVRLTKASAGNFSIAFFPKRRVCKEFSKPRQFFGTMRDILLPPYKIMHFNQIPVFIRYCGCRNLSPLFSSCSIYILDELIACGIRGIGTL
ncbi:hypothetical protein ALC57_09533 [Trachymyrmex cornetzi]|uniref:Uncharacterized protein n=1 Tax=Trachymyrmex cornetzi TaxID=471704 RepID=A0A195DZ89_9HYME|nr:hypothetical protein ALC57_09533 [Trachymyrmex cornetzi]